MKAVKKISKILGWIVGILLLLLLILVVTFSFSRVQTKTAQKLTSYLKEEADVDLQLDRIKITYKGEVDLENVFLKDHHNDTLMHAQSLKTSLLNVPGFLNKDFEFGRVDADHLTFRLRRYNGDDKDSFGIFLEKLESENPSEETTKVAFKRLVTHDSKFSFYDEQGGHPDIIQLDSMNLDAKNFVVDGGRITTEVKSLAGYDKRGVHLEKLTTLVEYNDSQLNFDDLNIKTKESEIGGTIYFTYNKTMSNFENRVLVDADFEKADISTTELHRYYSPIGKNKRFSFRTKMKGVLNDFKLHNLDLTGINRTIIKGDVGIKNIFGDIGVEMNGDFEQLVSNYHDLVDFLPEVLGESLPPEVKELGEIDLKGRVEASGNRVITNSHIHSKFGVADIDAGLVDIKKTGGKKYHGEVTFRDFELGDLINNPDVGKATFTMNLEGKGLKRDELNSELNGNFKSLVFNGYTYEDIDVKGELKNPMFSGRVTSHDENLRMKFNGVADVSGQETNYDFKANIDHADFHALNINPKDSVAIFKGDIIMDLKGTHLDDIVGQVIIANASYENKKGEYPFDQLELKSSFEEQERTLSVHSADVVDGQLQGDFILRDLPVLFKNSIGNLYRNYKPTAIKENQYVDFNFDIHSKIVEAIYPNISVAPGTAVAGKVYSEDSEVEIDFNSPEISILNNTFQEVNLDLDNNNPKSTTSFSIDSISTNKYNFSNLNIRSNRMNDTLYIQSNLTGGNHNKDQLNLNLSHTINEDNESVIGLEKSDITFKDYTWIFNEEGKENKIVFDNQFENLQTDTLDLSFGDEKITFVGSKHGDSEKDFTLNFDEVDLYKITPDVKDFELNGLVNGTLNVNQRDGIYYPGSDLRILNVDVNDIDYGNLKLDIEGNQSLTSYKINAELACEDQRFMNAEGEINVNAQHPSIDLDVELNEFDVAILNTFGKDAVSNIRGVTTGKAHLGGNYKRPDLSGQLTLSNAGLKIPYLNVDLAMDQNTTVDLSADKFTFNQVDFKDTKYGTEGIVDGYLKHKYFKNWSMDLEMNAPDRLLVLDTDYTDESLYYGTAFINGRAKMKGPFDELVFDVSAASEKGTVFKIPLNDSESIVNHDFIYFLTEEDKDAQKRGEDIYINKIKGLELNFDLDVNDNADIEIVVDKESGSTLRGKGEGSLLMEINTGGKFNMWGDYVVLDGVYNLKYGGLIEKEFEVVSGGSIAWTGSPTQANLNVRGLYKTEANPAALLENPTVNRSIPVNVYVDLTGLLSNVTVDFELEYPNLSSVVKSELEYRISDKDNTELQALSLITQRSFYSESSDKNAHPENLLYERAAGIFDDLFSDEGDKFKVGVDYTKGMRSPDQDIADRVGVSLSTNVNDRIIINGKVGVPVGGLTQSTVVGDVEMEFLLNKEGNLRAKLFNRESDIQYIGEELGYTQGVGLSYSVDFDTFKEMIYRILNKKTALKKQKKKEEEEKNDDLIPDYIEFPGS